MHVIPRTLRDEDDAKVCSDHINNTNATNHPINVAVIDQLHTTNRIISTVTEFYQNMYENGQHEINNDKVFFSQVGTL